jgi:hypothetical protein
MRVFKPQQQKVDISKIKYQFFVFDTETTKLEPMSKNFVFGVLYGATGHKIFYSVDDFKKEFSRPYYKNKFIFAHNAEFDLLTIYGNIYQNLDNSAVFNGKFISAKFNGITFGDSMNIYPASVKKIGELIGLPKYENSKISTENLTPDNIQDQDIIYCIRDCEIVFTALRRIFEMTGSIKLTLPSLSMYDFRTNYLQKKLFYSELIDDFFESYYGGRCEAFRIGKVNASVFDVNSLYPSVMLTTKFPDIAKLKKEIKVNKKFLLYALKWFEGMAKVRVRHKNTYFGFLPVRMKIAGFSKLVFPVGEFDVTVNFSELRFAIEQDVIEIVKVYELIYAPPIDSIFTDFITDNYNKRLTTDDPLNREIYKLKMNSLYGKFGQRIKYHTTYYDELPVDMVQEFEKTGVWYELKPFSFERSDCFIITENKGLKFSYFAIPAFASYITSAARLKLLSGLLSNQDQQPCYSDTDSIFLNGEFSGNISPGLGAWKKESKQVIEVRGLKNYTYINETGETVETIKGVSKNSKKIFNETTGQYEYHTAKYYKTLQGLRQSKEAGESFLMIKTLTQPYDKRIVLKNGNTKPIKL